jgi:hypothetical protein
MEHIEELSVLVGQFVVLLCRLSKHTGDFSFRPVRGMHSTWRYFFIQVGSPGG